MIIGDGLCLMPYEECDDGNIYSHDGCSNEGKLEYGFDCWRKSQNESHLMLDSSPVDTYCELPKTKETEAAETSAKFLPALLILKSLLNF